MGWNVGLWGGMWGCGSGYGAMGRDVGLWGRIWGYGAELWGYGAELRGYGVGCGDEANDVTKGGGANDLYWMGGREGRGFPLWAGLRSVGVASWSGRGSERWAWLREWAWLSERAWLSEVGVASGSRRGFGGAWLQKRAWLLMGVASHSRSGFRRGGAWLRKWAWLQAVGVSQRRM